MTFIQVQMLFKSHVFGTLFSGGRKHLNSPTLIALSYPHPWKKQEPRKVCAGMTSLLSESDQEWEAMWLGKVGASESDISEFKF